MNTMAILVACGREEEIAPGTEAAFLPLGSRPIIGHSLKTLEDSDVVDSVVVVVSKDRLDSTIHIIRRYGCAKVRGVVVGGVTRLSSLRTVFSKIQTDPSVMIVHEASRPFLSQRMLEETVKRAKRYGCAIAAHRIPDAVKLAPKGGKATATLERNTLWAAQTPQAFKTPVLKKIIDSKTKEVKIIDDESQFVSGIAETQLVEAGYANMKIRNRFDLEVAAALLHANLAGEESGPRIIREVAVPV